MPFEIKTGRANTGMEARAQTMLYTVLMAERYGELLFQLYDGLFLTALSSGTEVPAGLLYYTQNDSLIRVSPSRHELRGLIISRNTTASYMMRRRPISDRRGGEDRLSLFDEECPKETASQIEEAEDFLPPTIDQEWTCKKCYAADGCMLYRKVGCSLISLTTRK